jgi:preprotein translocase subunit SecE
MKEAKVEPRVAGRESKAGAAAGSWLSNVRTWPKQTKTFLSDVRAETRRVTWPTRSMIRATTIVVIVTVFFFGLYFAVLDYIFSEAVGRLLRWGG